MPDLVARNVPTEDFYRWKREALAARKSLRQYVIDRMNGMATTDEQNDLCFVCSEPLTVAEMTESGLYPPQTGPVCEWTPIMCHKCAAEDANEQPPAKIPDSF